jgi:bifunctional non-homologous end joining protein LigD
MRPSHREELPRFIEPMLATSAPAPAGERWAMEIKWDGMRAQLRVDGSVLCLRSRSGRDCTSEFPELAVVAEQLGHCQVIVDAELVCFGSDGKPDFAALRARIGRREGRVATAARRGLVKLVAFDVLHLDGAAVRRLPYSRRRELLAELVVDGPALIAPRHFVEQREAVLSITAYHGLEGVVAKRLDAPYREGRRSRSWIKVKHRRRERMVVTGWRERDGELPEFLLARVVDSGRLRPAGSASLGLDPLRRAELIEHLTARELPRRTVRGGRARWAAPGIEVIVDAHGSRTGPVRDPIIRAFEVA